MGGYLFAFMSWMYAFSDYSYAYSTLTFRTMTITHRPCTPSSMENTISYGTVNLIYPASHVTVSHYIHQGSCLLRSGCTPISRTQTKKTLLKGLQIGFPNSPGLWTIARYRTCSSPLPAFSFLRKLCSPARVRKSPSFHYRRS